MMKCGTGSHSSGLQRRPGFLVRGWSWDRSESTCPAHRIVQGFGSIQGPVIRDKGGLLSQRFAGHSDPPGSRKGFPWRRTSWALAKPPISLQLERPSAGVAIVEGLLSPAVAPIPRPPLCSLLLDPLRPPRPLLELQRMEVHLAADRQLCKGPVAAEARAHLPRQERRWGGLRIAAVRLSSTREAARHRLRGCSC
jgi:hypothetical protein